MDSLQKPYFILTVPIGTVQTDVEYHVLGRQFIVLTCPVDVTCRVNSVEADAFSLLKVAGYKGPFTKLYFTNASTSSTSVQLLVGVSVDLAVSAPKTQVQVLDSLGIVEDPLYTGAYDAANAAWRKMPAVYDGVDSSVPVEVGRACDAYRMVRRGQLLFDDGFESADNWQTESGTQARTTAAGEVFHGAGALKLTTGAISGNTAGAQRYQQFPPLKRLCFEINWEALSVATNPEFYALLSFVDVANGKEYQYGIQYLHASTKFQYVNAAGAWTDLTGSFDVGLIANNWQHWFIDVDIANGKYSRAVLNGKSFDMSALSLYSIAYTTQFGLFFPLLKTTTRTAAATNICVDDVVVSGVLNLT